MKKLKEKFSKNGGFTLVEMLIVVAIIAILIAVSIPLVNNALERTKHATDAANERAAKAEILLCYLADTGTTVNKGDIFFYDAVNGKLVAKADFSKIVGYGKHNGKGHSATSVIAVTINDKEEVEMQWTETAIDSITNGGLCSAAKDVDHTA